MPEVMPPAGNLRDLPKVAGGIAAATARAARGLIEASVRRMELARDAHPSVVAIRAVQAEIRLFLEREGEGVILFFWRRELPKVLSMKARVRFTVAPAPAAPPGEALSHDGAPVHHVVVPPCLMASPTKEDLARYAPPGTTAKNGVLLRVGAGGACVLAIKHPEEGLDAEIAYTVDRRLTLERPWLARPFLDLVESLRAWMAGETSAGPSVRLAMASDPAKMPHARQMLHFLGESYVIAERAADQEARSLPDEPWAALVPRYEPGDYSADIDLRLDDLGDLAGPDTERPVTLGLRSSVAREAGHVVVRTELRPPGFFVGGPLIDSFLAGVRDQVTGDLLDALGLTEEAWGRLVGSAPGTVVFKNGSGGEGGEEEEHVMVLRGPRGRALVLGVEAKVVEDERTPSVSVSGVTLLHDSQKDEDKAMDDSVALRFVRLVASLQGCLLLAG